MSSAVQSRGDAPQVSELFLVLILAGVQFSHIMDFMVMMPLGPQLMQVFGIGTQAFGLVVSVYTFSAAVSCFLAATVMDRFDRRTVLLTIYAGLVVGTFLCGMAPTFYLLLGARVVTGIFGGLLQAVILSFIGDVVSEKRRGRAIGMVMTAFSVASVVGIPAGLAVANAWGWNSVFLGLGCLSALNLGLAYRFLPSVRGHLGGPARSVLGGFADLLRRPNTWLATAVIFTMMTVFGLFPFVSPFLVQVVGIKFSSLSELYFFAGVASLIVTPLAGRLADRFGVKPVIVVSACLSAPATIVFANLGVTPLSTTIALNTVVSAVGAGRMTPAMTLINGSVERARRGSFMTLISAVQQISASFWSFGGGWLLGASASGTDTGGLSRFPLLGLIVAAGMIISMLLSLALRPVAD